MSGHESLAERVLMVPVREVTYMVRGLLYAVAADPVAAIVFGLLVLSSPLIWKASRAAARWIDRRLPTRCGPCCNNFDDFDRIVEREFGGRFPDDKPAQPLPGVTHLGPTPPPPGRRVLRRMPRIPGRPRSRRHRTTSSSSDRRTR